MPSLSILSQVIEIDAALSFSHLRIFYFFVTQLYWLQSSFCLSVSSKYFLRLFGCLMIFLPTQERQRN